MRNQSDPVQVQAELLQRNHALLKRSGYGRGAVIHPQLIVDVDEVGFDGGCADVEGFADFFVAFAAGHQLQYFNFTGTQIFFGRGTHAGYDAGGNGGRQHRIAFGGGPNRTE